MATGPVAGQAAPGRDGALARAFPALAVGPYRLLLSGNLCAMLAYQASVVATGYAAFQMTGAATMLGLISLALLGLAFVPLLFGMPYQTLMPVFAERVFAVGAEGLGVLMASAGVGSLLGSIAVAALAGFRRPDVLQLGVGVLFGAGLLGFALAPSFLVAVALLLVVGFASAAYTAINNTLVLANAEPRLHGRVMSVYLITFAVSPVAALPMSWLADWLGAPVTVAGGGLIVAAVVAGFAALYPAYRSIH